MRILSAAAALVFFALFGAAQAEDTISLSTHEGDFTLRNFKFQSGETLSALRLHYLTLGAPKRDAKGHVTNAVLILHGTGGSGRQFLQPQFANVLFASGGLLDPARYFVILPDDIGHGKSSKPSDGLHAKFPQYDYDDMVEAQYRLLTKGLQVDHLRLIMGTSMGCMHAFVWGETHAAFMDALMPLACLPVQIASRNRMWRKMIMDAITEDPAWQAGEYKTEPMGALRAADELLVVAGSAPLYQQKTFPDRDSADKYVSERVAKDIAGLDANDLLYQVAASSDYDPSAKLEKIQAPVMWVNSADDFINPPELGIAEREVRRLSRGTFILIPASETTHGHGTHTWAAIWQSHLKELLEESKKGTNR